MFIVWKTNWTKVKVDTGRADRRSQERTSSSDRDERSRQTCKSKNQENLKID